MSQPECTHCGGLHYGSVLGHCPYICDKCHCDIRPDALPRCACPKDESIGFFEKVRQLEGAPDWRLKEDLAMLVRRMGRRIKKLSQSPNDRELVEKAFQFLDRYKLNGSILREEKP